MLRHLSFSWLLYLFTAALAAAVEPAIRFADATAKTGLVEPLAGIMGHGGAWGDVDGDGWPDLFVGGFCDRPNKEYAPAAGPVPTRLLRNIQGTRFELLPGPPTEFFGRTSGAVFADLDNSGHAALYVANNARAKSGKADEPQKSAQVLGSKLFRNAGGKLVETSPDSGACPPNLLTARNIGVFDFDGDRLLDLFVVEDKFRGGGSRSVLLRNEGNFKFTDATHATGLPENIFGLGLAVADLNGDHRPDFFVPHGNRLFLSAPGNKYREATELADVFAWKPLDNEDWPCGAAFADLNRDGKLDLVLSIHHGPARNKAFLNVSPTANEIRFRDVTPEAGLDTPVPVRCPHVEVQDFDNDGWLDIYVSAAWLDDERITPLIYRNQGLVRGVPRFEPPRKIEPPMVYFPAGPTADYDHDGRLDLFLINWFAGNHCRLLHNESDTRHWLDVQVVGKTVNRMGLGSRIRIYVAGHLGAPQHLLGDQELNIGYGYASGQLAVAHFGLGTVEKVDLEVTLPNGRTLTRKSVADQRVTIAE